MPLSVLMIGIFALEKVLKKKVTGRIKNNKDVEADKDLKRPASLNALLRARSTRIDCLGPCPVGV